MPISATTLKALMAGGLAGDALIVVVEAIDADMEAQRPAIDEQAERRRARDRHRAAIRRMSADESADIPPLPDKENGTKEINPSPPASLRSDNQRALEREFDSEFWPNYPRRVGKSGALKAFARARKAVPLATITVGLARYVKDPPDDPKFWKHPATWLNGEHWNDEPAASSKPPRPGHAGESILDAVARAAEARARGHRWEAGSDGRMPSDAGTGPPDRGSHRTIDGELAAEAG